MKLSELRALAERATKGPWFTLGKPWTHDNQTDLAVIAGNPDPHKGTLIAECSLAIDWTDGDDDPRIQEQKDAAYIAAANPSVVLELLERLEAMEKALVAYGVCGCRGKPYKCLLCSSLAHHGSAVPLKGEK